MAQGLKPGTILRGSYRIERILGQGGFGITYLAIDLNLDRKVAVKEFFPKDYCDRNDTTSQVTLGTQNTAEFVNRLKAKFIKEAKNIAKFDNPGIIKIHAAFEENNTAYYVMDFIEGESLSAIVKRNGPLPETLALQYISKVGKALEYVHSHRMNHLDVKPANIMVRRSDNEPILIDFGLSKQYDTEGHQTSTTPTGISHGYAPMEQYNDGGVKEFSPQTDLYSLAATLYYILSGIVPPQATRLVDDELTFPASIPANLISPIAKAMSTARRNRQENVGRFLGEITPDPETIIEPKPTPKPEPKPEPKPAPKPKPQPTPQPLVNKTDDSGKNKKWFYIGGIAVVIILAIIFIPKGTSSSSNDNIADSTSIVEDALNTEKPQTVNGAYYKSSLGACSYTGEVDSDGKPHGKGKAEWESGLGKSYDGQWEHGVMEGKCTYISRGNYRFEGTFKQNHYSEGKLVSPDGSYYEGSFDKNGEKWTGTEYDKNGNKTDTWTNGE